MIRQNYTLDILDNGDRRYYYKYQLHRSNGPALINISLYQCCYYYRYDKCHRLDGPAVIWNDGDEYYWVNNWPMSKENFYENYYQEKYD